MWPFAGWTVAAKKPMSRERASLRFTGSPGHRPKRFPEEGQDRGVLGEGRPVVQLQRGHAAERVDLHVLGGSLLAL